MEYLGILAVYLALCWTGCSVPPDWSVCECNWLDNTWFHHITVLHSYSGDDFVNYLVNPAHPLHAWVLKQECPQQISTFMYNSEGKVYSFDPKGLMKLSNEAWRPENRQTITSSCAVGNMLLHFWCSHQFLYKAGSPSVALDEKQRWEMLRGWYAHMNALRQFIELPELQSCLPRSSFPFTSETVTTVHDWVFASIGNATRGEEPKLMFNTATGLIHIPSFAFRHVLRHSRRHVNPKNRVCLPLINRSCWPEKAQWQSESCTLCCDPSKGPFGDPSCFQTTRSYSDCCQQDFKGVMCDEIRKSTPGCLDCPQHLSFYCAEEHKFRVVKSWSLMNETYWKHKEELNTTIALEEDIMYNKNRLGFFEKIFNESLPKFVESETEYITNGGVHRITQFAIDRQNKTYLKYMNDEFIPIEKNFTRARNAFKSLNDTYSKAVSNQRIWPSGVLAEFRVLETLSTVCKDPESYRETAAEELELAKVFWNQRRVDKGISKETAVLKSMKKPPSEKQILSLELGGLLMDDELPVLLAEGKLVLWEYWRGAWLEQRGKLRSLVLAKISLGEEEAKVRAERREIRCKEYSKKRHSFLKDVIDNDAKVIEIEPKLEPALLEFRKWNETMNIITSVVEIEKNKLALVAMRDQQGAFRDKYHTQMNIHSNNSNWLNKTYVNLTEHEDKLSDSKRNTMNLASEFKKFESEYFRYEEIYKNKSENGEIIIKDFTFEY